MNQQKLIEDRAKECSNKYKQLASKSIARRCYIKGATDQASQSYSREEVDSMLKRIKEHAEYFRADVIISKINEFNEKHKG